MDALTAYAERLNHLPVDLRAEVVLADMLEDGISLNDLIINPLGPFKRAFGRDISRTDWVESQHSPKRWLQIDLNRNGLYDLLPEGVFHQPTTNETTVSKEATLLEMKVQHGREQAARRFFLPIEQEFFRQRICIEQEQRSFLLNADTLRPDDLLGRFWNLPDFLTSSQTKRLLYLLPVMHRIAGDMAAMAACFEQLMDERVSLQFDPPGLELVQANIAERSPAERSPAGPKVPPLGQWQLGNNSVFDGWLPNEGPSLRITVHLKSSDRVSAYLPGQNGRQLVEWLSGYLVPLDVDVRIDIDTSALEDTFLFSSDDPYGRLDFTTYV